jgi:hypothetical protein
VVFNICLERSFHFNYPCGTLCHLLLHPQLNYSRGEEVAALVTTLDFTDKKKITVPICGLIDPHIILLSTRWMMIHHVDILCKMQVRPIASVRGERTRPPNPLLKSFLHPCRMAKLVRRSITTLLHYLGHTASRDGGESLLDCSKN